MSAELEKEQFENELRDLVSRYHEGMNASDIIFRVLKDRVIQEREIGQYLDWLYSQHEFGKRPVEPDGDGLPW